MIKCTVIKCCTNKILFVDMVLNFNCLKNEGSLQHLPWAADRHLSRDRRRDSPVRAKRGSSPTGPQLEGHSAGGALGD